MSGMRGEMNGMERKGNAQKHLEEESGNDEEGEGES